MTRLSRPVILAALFAIPIAAALLPAGSAQAQWYSSAAASPPPLYPYAVDTRQPYAVEVAPNTYEIRRPGGAGRGYTGARILHRPETDRARRPAAVASRVDPALIEELRNGGKPNTRPNTRPKTVNTTRVVREAPTVIEHKRYVDDPPRVVTRYTVVDDTKPAPGHGAAPARSARPPAQPSKPGDQKRVIQADAEITILGPDRMSIRLFRKGSGGKVSASVE